MYKYILLNARTRECGRTTEWGNKRVRAWLTEGISIFCFFVFAKFTIW